MLTDILATEPSLGDLIFENIDAKTAANINGTCKTLNALTKDNVRLWHIDYTIMKIPIRFEELAKNMMFYLCTEEEYQSDLIKLSESITDEISSDVIDIFLYNYNWYKHEALDVDDMVSDVYESIAIQYKDFLKSMNVPIDEDDND